MIEQIKTDDALTAAWWHDVQAVTTNPNGTQANPAESVRKAYHHLKKVIPDGHIYCVATQTGHQSSPHHKWFRTAEAAATFAVYEALVRHTKGIWYASSGYTDEPILNKYGNPSRSSKNVSGVKALWVDLDVAKPIPSDWLEPIKLLNARNDKHEVIAKLPVDQQEMVRDYLKELDKYHSQQEAVEGLVNFINNTGLTPSNVVSSGRGIHVYWYLSESLSHNAWKALADQFKALTESHGLKADPMRTADSASLMRLPGTWHRKGDPLEVFSIQDNDKVYTYEAIEAIVREKLRLTNPSAIKNMQVKHAPTGVAAALIRPNEFAPANAELVSTKCQQVKFFRQSRGMVDEPVWYLLAGTLAHCDNGEAYYQEWSSGHPDYNYAATNDKLIQWQERATGPSSCAAFEAKNPTGCAGCPHKGKIAYPVQLGEEAAPLITAEAMPAVKMADENGEVDEAPYVPPTSIGNFRRTTKGIQVVDDSLPAPITICDYDVWISRNAHDNYSDTRQANVCYKDHHGDIFEYQTKASVLFDPKQLLAWCCDKGLFIKPDHAKAMSAYLQAYITELSRSQKTISLHSTMGWSVQRDTDGREKRTTGFVLGNRMITTKGTVEAGLSPRVREFANEFHSSGDKDRWIRATSRLNERGFEAQAFTLLCGFGAPLMRFTGNIHGSILSLVGPSGTGKTSAMQFALSIYGRPDKMMMKWGDTLNSVYGVVSQTKSMPLGIDEMTNADPLAVSQLAYDMSNGKPKGRMKSDATLQRSDTDLWHTICIATTNESLIDKVKFEKSDPTAAMARILELPMYLDDRWQEFCENEFVDSVFNNYGVIGEEYLNYVVRNEATLKDLIPKMLLWVKDNGSKLGQHRFLNATVACAIVGGQIAKNLGLIQFEIQPVIDWILERLKEHGGKSKLMTVNPYETLGTFLAENNGKVLSVKEINGVSTMLTEVRGVLVARLDTTGGKLYIRKDALEKWLTTRAINHSEVLLELMRNGVLERGHHVHDIAKGIHGSPPVRVQCYVFDAEKMGISVNVPDPVA